MKYASAGNRGVRHGSEFVQESSEYSVGHGERGTAVVYSNGNVSIFKFKERASCIDEGIIRVELMIKLRECMSFLKRRCKQKPSGSGYKQKTRRQTQNAQRGRGKQEYATSTTHSP